MDYDSKEGISDHIGSLAAFHKLCRERHAAGYDRKEQLTEFFVLGRFQLDSCGNTSVFVQDFLPHRSFPDIPPILTGDEFDEFLRRKRVSAFGTSIRSLPNCKDVCPECGVGWSIDDVEDSVIDRGDVNQYCHHLCHVLKYTRLQSVRFREILEQAGFRDFGFARTQNQYAPGEGSIPWLLVSLESGQSITLGWRKRVIEIDFSETAFRGDITNGEDVTKGPDSAHAWGYDKALEYLTRLKQGLDHPIDV